MDAFQYRTKGEEDHVERLTALDPSLLASRADRVDVDDRAMCFADPKLCVDLRSLEKANLHYWSNFVRNKPWTVWKRDTRLLFSV